MSQDYHRWTEANVLYCPEGGDMLIYQDGDGVPIYDMGGTRVLITGQMCPECGQKIGSLERNYTTYDKTDLELEMIEEQGE